MNKRVKAILIVGGIVWTYLLWALVANAAMLKYGEEIVGAVTVFLIVGVVAFRKGWLSERKKETKKVSA